MAKYLQEQGKTGYISWIMNGTMILSLSLLAAYSGSEKLVSLLPWLGSVILLTLFFLFTKAATKNQLSAAAATLVLGTSLGWTYSTFTNLAGSSGTLGFGYDSASCFWPYSRFLCLPELSWSANALSLALDFMPWSLLLPLVIYSFWCGLTQLRADQKLYDCTMALGLVAWLCLAATKPQLAHQSSLIALIALAYFTGLSIERCPQRGLGKLLLFSTCILLLAACTIGGLLSSSILYLSYIKDPVVIAPLLFSPSVAPFAQAVLVMFSSSATAFALLLGSLGLGILTVESLWQGYIRNAFWTLGAAMVLLAFCAKLIVSAGLTPQLS